MVVPAGRSHEDAAAWVGASCWAEQRVHDILTDWLADAAGAGDGPAGEASPSGIVGRWWTIRAHRADSAEAWYRRLPELREQPRSGFVAPHEADRLALDGAAEAEGAVAREQAVHAMLTELRDRYRAHRDVAVGPADGPVADTLRRLLSMLDADLQSLA